MDEKGSFSSWSLFQLCLFSRLWASLHIPCEFKCNFYVKPSKANLNSKRWISELLLHNNGQFIVTNSRLWVPTPSSKVKHLVFIKKKHGKNCKGCRNHYIAPFGLFILLMTNPPFPFISFSIAGGL